MKNLLLFTLLVSSHLFGQNYLTIDKEARIYDIPNGDFLTAFTAGNKTYIQHYNSSGALLWEDSVTYIQPISPVYLNEIAQFKNTDEFIVSTYGRLYDNPSPWENDTLVYQFSKLNLSTHTFTSHLANTFVGKSIDMTECSDTSIYLFVSDYSISYEPFNIATYSINPSLNISTIAPIDSVQVNSGGNGARFIYGDTVYFLRNFYGHNSIKKYSTQMSLQQTNSLDLYTNMDSDEPDYTKPFNSDSIFIFTEGYSSGTWTVKWRMDWLDLSLNTINSTIFNSPPTAELPQNYQTSFYNVAIDKTNRKIVILTKDESPMPSSIQQKLFIYDFDFNLVCEIPSTIGTQDENVLVELNGLVYLRNTNSINSNLTLIDCSILNVSELESDKEFDIYPNPSSSNITISNPELKELFVTLKSADGKEIGTYSSLDLAVEINLDSLSSGIYFLNINDGTSDCIRRVIKE